MIKGFKRILKYLGFFKDEKAQEKASSNPNSRLTGNEDLILQQSIIEVAAEFEDQEKFMVAANKEAAKMSFGSAKKLINYFHHPPPQPGFLKEKIQKQVADTRTFGLESGSQVASVIALMVACIVIVITAYIHFLKGSF